MRVAEYIARFLNDHVTRVYAVCGAGAMHLNDAICHQPGLEVIAVHHEQAGAMAAEMDARVTGKMACVHVTTGPGGTNAITGIAGAYVDSVPMLIIAGQVARHTMIDGSGTRQIGPNELDLVSIVKPITKYAETVRHKDAIRHMLEFAVYMATTGRQGPVFIEVPLDVQNAEIDPDSLKGFTPNVYPMPVNGVRRCLEMLEGAKKPLILAGNGVHLAGAEEELRTLVALGLPVVTAWGGTDLIPTNHPNYIGHVGLMGDRAGNFAVQEADVLLVIGSRLSIPVIGHTKELFAPKAKLIVVDIDQAETTKKTIRTDLPIVADAKDFLIALTTSAPHFSCGTWMAICRHWKAKYPVMLPEYRDTSKGINSYFFMEVLAKLMDDDAILVADVGVAVLSAMQSMPLNGRQRLLHSGGVSAMGIGLPGAIGAYLGGAGRQTISLNGDGGMMMNLQELQTVAHHQLPIKIFVFCNKGYLTMRFTQNTHFGRESIAGTNSDLTCANFFEAAPAFGIPAMRLTGESDLAQGVKNVLLNEGPVLCEVHSPEDQLLMPRVKSRIEDGKFLPARLDDMWPHLQA
jgi:acetolactate synthase-1/2/3 large subunit